MFQRIKELADEAVKLQNKLQMESALREISDIAFMAGERTCFEDARKAKFGVKTCGECGQERSLNAEEFEAAELAQHHARNGLAVEVVAGEKLKAGEPVSIVMGKARKAVKK